MHISETEFDARLSAQARPTPEIDRGLVLALMNQAGTRARGRRRRWLALGAGVALAGCGLAIPATAIATHMFRAQTGVFNVEADGSAPTAAQSNERAEVFDPGTEGAPGAEWIDMASPDLESYMRSVAPTELPLPPGMTWGEAMDGFLAGFSQSEYLASNDLGGGGGIRAESVVIDIMLENHARKLWLTEWFDAYGAHDRARMLGAGDALTASVDWPAEVASSGGAYAEQMRVWMRVIGAGDFDAAQAYAETMEWSELWDGQERGDLVGDLYAGTVAVPGEGGAA
ncbi:hypothetical protein [Leucobacter japonicus]|uniref:hypothetical protein n=1 Tax=Leucobacter japonicus TaxID=1461259 RepID=UPI000AC9C879|nr:hypothetical protein [Leucobacter japonicus]